MEANHMNPAAPEDAEIEARLRQPCAPLSDDGFTARVLAALPPRSAAPRQSPWRAVILIAGLIAGVAVAAFRIGSWAKLGQEWAPLRDALAQLAAPLADPPAALGLALAGASALLARARPRTLQRWLSLPRWR